MFEERERKNKMQAGCGPSVRMFAQVRANQEVAVCPKH